MGKSARQELANVYETPERLGKYEIIRRLATGVMAEIYLAAARGIEGCEKLVVIKRMLPRLAADIEFVKMGNTQDMACGGLLQTCCNGPFGPYCSRTLGCTLGLCTL